MLATDVAPDRLDRRQGRGPRRSSTGCPSSSTSGWSRSPATRRCSCRRPPTGRPSTAGIDRLAEGSAGRAGTAIGDAIATVAGGDPHARRARPARTPPPARVVLLSDGANTAGRDPDEAAAEAATEPACRSTRSRSAPPTGTSTAAAGASRCRSTARRCSAVAEATGGSYHEAGSGDELREVYADIGSSVGYRTERQDVSARFIGIGLVLALLAAAGLDVLVRPAALTERVR